MTTPQPPGPDSAAAATVSRRGFLGAGAATMAAPVLAAAGLPPAAVAAAPAKGPAGRRPDRHNLLFVFTDQERHMTRWPAGFTLPGHARLQRSGTAFNNHYNSSTMCTSSRAVLLTGLQTPDNGMFDNTDMPYQKALSPTIPTIGTMLRQAGYVTTYKGKWHLDPAFDKAEPERPLGPQMERFGFSDFVWPGDHVAHTLGGHRFDHLIAANAVTWMRRRGRALNDEGKPWAMFVSLVNPHDIMYFNTDAPGESVQDTGRLLMHAARAPRHADYAARWNAPLPATLRSPLNAPGRPAAHAEFDRAWGYTLGRVPIADAPWQRFSDYYLNCIRAVDAQLNHLLAELDRLGMNDKTIVVFTADHGEMGGAHGLRGKGPYAYEESIHIPMHIVHPDVRGGQSTKALTSHIDLAPSLLAMAGVNATRAGELAGRSLPGKDLSMVLANPGGAAVNALHESVLFTYSGIATNDADIWQLISEAKAAGKDPKAAIQASGYKPNMKKRGSLRTAFDGRHKFSRYFAPVERNRPTTLEALYRNNDVELFDLQADPAETTNLAADPKANPALVMAMSNKLEAAIKAEIGVDDGREMPDVDGIRWAIDSLDL
jgi:arylsulfatase A-like enzyme